MPARDLAPPCQDAAPLIKSSRPSGQYLVVYSEGVDARAMTAQLAASYQFTAIYVFVGAPFRGSAPCLPLKLWPSCGVSLPSITFRRLASCCCLTPGSTPASSENLQLGIAGLTESS